MRIHYLQHVAFEGPAAIADWAAERGHRLAGTRVYQAHKLPAQEAFDWLVVLGGPMNVDEESEHSWLAPETALIRETIAAGKPVLGICLGAQLIAKALGAPVAPGAEKEIGWFEVASVTPTVDGAFDGLPARFTPLHWHGDEVVELPPGGIRLASTEACANQAFQIGRNVIGLQFHVEATPDSVEALVTHAGHEINAGRFQQAPASIRDCEAACTAVRPILHSVLGYLEARR